MEEAVGLGLMAVISLTAGCNGGLSEDKVLSGLSVGDGQRSDEELLLRPSGLGLAWAGTCDENGAA